MLIVELRLHSEAEEFIDSIDLHNSITTTGADGPRIVFHKTRVMVGKALEHLFDLDNSKFDCVPYIVCFGAGVYEPVAEMPVMLQYQVRLNVLLPVDKRVVG